MGRQEWNRAVAFEAYEKNRNKDVPPLKFADNIDNWIKDAAEKELSDPQISQRAGHSHRSRLGPALHPTSDARISSSGSGLRLDG